MLKYSPRALILALALALPASAGAFSIGTVPNGSPVRWSRNALPATYWLQQDGSADVSDGSDLEAWRKGLADWAAVDCSAITFRELGLTANRQVTSVQGVTNGRNEFVVIEDLVILLKHLFILLVLLLVVVVKLTTSTPLLGLGLHTRNLFLILLVLVVRTPH